MAKGCYYQQGGCDELQKAIESRPKNTDYVTHGCKKNILLDVGCVTRFHDLMRPPTLANWDVTSKHNWKLRLRSFWTRQAGSLYFSKVHALLPDIDVQHISVTSAIRIARTSRKCHAIKVAFSTVKRSLIRYKQEWHKTVPNRHWDLLRALALVTNVHDVVLCVCGWVVLLWEFDDLFKVAFEHLFFRRSETSIICLNGQNFSRAWNYVTNDVLGRYLKSRYWTFAIFGDWCSLTVHKPYTASTWNVEQLEADYECLHTITRQISQSLPSFVDRIYSAAGGKVPWFPFWVCRTA